MNEIIKYDKDFDESVFLTKADHIFIMILDAIMDNDMSSVKHYLTDEIYNRYVEMVNEYIEKGYTRLFDEMNVKSTEITGVNFENDKINIIVNLVSRYMDYFVDDNGDYVSGINTHRIEKSHTIIFSKNLDAKKLNEARRCPSCGNSLNINNTGVCPYCNQTIDMSKYDYIITQIDTI